MSKAKVCQCDKKEILEGLKEVDRSEFMEF